MIKITLVMSILTILLILNKNINNFYSQHLTELFPTHTRRSKFVEGNFTILILVHLGKCRLGDHVLGCHVGVLSLQQAVHVHDQPLHLLIGNGPVAVHVEHPEDLTQDLLGGSVRHHVEDDHELHKVDIPIIVGIIYSKHMLLHLTGIFLWHCLRHHCAEIFWLHLAIWVFSNKSIKCFLDLFLLHSA